jgi:Mrp family chromosome partitioning ATPase
MSLVEKAIEKLRASAAQDVREPSPTPPPRIEPVVASSPGAPFTPERPASAGAPGTGAAMADVAARLASPPLGDVPRIAIDMAMLAREGVVAPTADAHRAAGDYRAIKRSVIAAAFGKSGGGSHDPRVIAVTSALAGDGKTHTSVNLALSLSRERDFGVVLVDADVLKGHVTELLGLEGRPGLTDLLGTSGEVDVRRMLVQAEQGNFWILPAGRRHEDATELLSSQRMGQVTAQLLALLPRALVLFDSPPLLLTSEAQAVTGLAGQVLLVVKAGTTPREAVSDAIDRVGDMDRISLVLNQVDRSGLSEYYYTGQYGAYAK